MSDLRRWHIDGYGAVGCDNRVWLSCEELDRRDRLEVGDFAVLRFRSSAKSQVEVQRVEDADIRPCAGCGVEKDKWELEEIRDAQGIYVGRFCSRKCAEKNSKVRLHRSWEEAMTAGDW